MIETVDRLLSSRYSDKANCISLKRDPSKFRTRGPHLAAPFTVAVWSIESRDACLLRQAYPALCRPAVICRGIFCWTERLADTTPVATNGGERPISTTDPRINEKIRVPRVRLIGVDGSQLGLFETADAQRIADDQNLDLVEVAPNSDPPVCRIMDYGKFKYEQDMKAKKARKHQTKVEIKEIKFRPKIDTHDYETKKKHVVRFLTAGAKVKVTIMFRGREMVHAERGLAILERLAADLEGLAIIESQPKLEGRNMFMLITPVKKDEKDTKAGDQTDVEPDAADDGDKE